MSLSPSSIDENFSLSEVNCQHAILKKLSSQKPLGIVQRNHFNGSSAVEPKNFCLINVGVHNLAVGQNVSFSADTDPFLKQGILETTNTNCRVKHLISILEEELHPPGSQN